MKIIIIMALVLISFQAFSESNSNTYNCKFDVGISPDSVEKDFILTNDWVNLSAKLEGINYFFNFSIFQSIMGPYIQYFEGVIDEDNVSRPIVGSSILLVPGQEKIGISNFICDGDSPCWTLNCTLNKF
jgi:hypothetical protein